MRFASQWVAGAAVFLAAGVISVLSGPAPGAGTNRVDYTTMSGTNAPNHEARWYEEPVKDPLTLLQEMQAKAQGDLEGAPLFTMQDGLYRLVTKARPPGTTATPAPDKLAAWDATPVHKEAPLDFSSVAPVGRMAVDSNGTARLFAGDLMKAPEAHSAGTIQFHAANNGDSLEAPAKARGLDDDALPGPPPNVPLQPQPQVASPEPDIIVLGILAFGAWRLVSVARRRD